MCLFSALYMYKCICLFQLYVHIHVKCLILACFQLSMYTAVFYIHVALMFLLALCKCVYAFVAYKLFILVFKLLFCFYVVNVHLIVKLNELNVTKLSI